ncbi:hypothetical protein Vafri_10022 [Volvox africanus]|uniref:Uncharacterized protein n=1 Tax=Volvox africanus TaxID=51714 RepID=A0A8J4B6V9_9CHLO|nr:hypothetical protein Vafri_10022 [Volvox africanus]
MEEVHTQIDDLLKKVYIVPSTSPYGAPILFVKKSRSDKLRMCIGFCALNHITIKNGYPLSWIDNLLDHLHRATLFSITKSDSHRKINTGVHSPHLSDTMKCVSELLVSLMHLLHSSP